MTSSYIGSLTTTCAIDIETRKRNPLLKGSIRTSMRDEMLIALSCIAQIPVWSVIAMHVRTPTV